MKKRQGLLKRLLSGALGVALVLAPVGVNQPMANVQAETVYEGAIDIEDGAILHAFCWSFNTIKNNMASIAAAGYSAIQTSPINECVATSPAMTLMGSNGKWYYHYQPTDWKIGNYQLGTRAEFKSMCAEADKYGIKIIVDVVPNHTATDTSQVSSNLINAVGGNKNTLYHSTGFTGIGDYSDRLQCTRYSMGGLPDVDTENWSFQNYFISYLNDCIACGADGFRYDTAKHIGLPDDPTASGVNNNFWTRVTTEITNASNIFNYGEVLQGANERLKAYQDMLDATTASSYGSTIRNAIVNKQIGVTDIMYYQIDSAANVDKLVTWVESHDNYLNDGTWSMLNEKQVKMAWAIVAARQAGAPLFFSRPYGSSTTNQYGSNTIGIAGSDIYKSAEVAAVNKFRNAMDGQSEYLRNPYDDARVLMIERGNKGVTIVNSSEYVYNLNGVTTNLADGTYYDHVDGSKVFTVSGGLLTGVLSPESVVVLYQGGTSAGAGVVSGSTTVYFYNDANWSTVSAYIYGDSTAFGSWPGKAATNQGGGWWKIDVPANVSSNLHIIFNNGGNGSQSADYLLNNASYVYATSSTLYNSKAAVEDAYGLTSTTVYYYNNSNWNNVSAYVYGDSTALGSWPGTAATHEGNGWWKIDVPAKVSSNLHIIFNDGGNGSQSSDYLLNNSSYVYGTASGLYDSKSAAESAAGVSYTTVYYYNNTGWSTVSAYLWGDSTAFGSWPGKAAVNEGNGWWRVDVPSKPSSNLHIIFNNGGNGSQSADYIINNASYVYSNSTGLFNSKSAAQ